MIKKFLSDALLSVVMDKKARKKLATMRAKEAASATEDVASNSTRSGRPETASPDAATQAEDLAQTIEQALADARREAAGDDRPRAAAAAPRSGAPTTQARQSPRTPTEHPAKPMTPDRERLIAETLNIQRRKTKVLDELDPSTREKLMVMAMMALDPDSLPGAGKNTKPTADPGKPVDEIGDRATKRPRRR